MFELKVGRNGRIRIADLPLRRRLLYPAELHSDGNKFTLPQEVIEVNYLSVPEPEASTLLN